MDLSANQRLCEFLEELKRTGVVTSDSDFAKRTGVGRSYVSELRNEKRPLTNSYVERISNTFPQVSPRWLLTGEGSMLLPRDEATLVENPEIVYLPIVPHSARAGTLGEYEQLFGDDYDRKQPVLVTKQMHGRYLCFRVEGDSMEPVLLHGDVVMARHIDRDLYKDCHLHLRSWSVWIVVTHTDGILIKSIAEHDVEGGTLLLHSLNTLYPDQTVRMADVIDIYNVIEIVSRHL